MIISVCLGDDHNSVADVVTEALINKRLAVRTVLPLQSRSSSFPHEKPSVGSNQNSASVSLDTSIASSVSSVNHRDLLQLPPSKVDQVT